MDITKTIEAATLDIHEGRHALLIRADFHPEEDEFFYGNIVTTDLGSAIQFSTLPHLQSSICDPRDLLAIGDESDLFATLDLSAHAYCFNRGEFTALASEVIFGTLPQYGIAIAGLELPDSGIPASVGVEVLEALRDGVREKLLEEKAGSELAGKLTVIDTWIASALDIEDPDTAISLLAGAEIEHDKTFIDIKPEYKDAIRLAVAVIVKANEQIRSAIKPQCSGVINEDVQAFMRAAGDTVQQYNERQAARYAGLMFEEFGEFVAELGYSGLSQELKDIGSDYKAGKMDHTIGEAVAHKAVHEAADNVWVAIGFIESMGFYTDLALQQLAIANLGKIGDDGVVLRDANGKIQKPEGWKPADMSELEIVTAESHLKAA